ncbi:MAG TPA: hypothetical protein VMZ52_20515 [Bryobacteraceae bacterium]|nr:hypothetical protein [Bryobacteraceae bacterium]
MVSLDMDPVLATLLVLLGATIFYLLDEVFRLTPRLSDWLEKVFGVS